MVQSNFDISGKQGIPQALNNLLQSFSAWGATPDNQAARQTVVQRATDFAQAFQQASSNAFRPGTATPNSKSARRSTR